jgi:threonine/homoserine/homoserine lactone efflux protein
MNLAAFAGAALVLGMIPGPSTAVIVRQALRFGRRAAWAATLGNETGLLLWCVAAATGLTTLVVASRIAYDVLRLVGAFFLVVLGIRALHGRRHVGDGSADARSPTPRRPRPKHSYRLGLATVLANPKSAVFALSFLPQFLVAGDASLPRLMVLSIVWICVDALWYVTLTLVVTRVPRLASGSPMTHRIEQALGGVLVALGVWIGIGNM